MSKAPEKILVACNGKKVGGAELTELRQVLSNRPDLWRLAGDVCQQIRLASLKSLEDNSLAYESVQFGLDQMRADLLREGSSALEHLLIEQVLTCWVQSSLIGMRYEEATKSSHSLTQGAYWEKRYNSSQARLVRSIEALARVRKLRLPNVQVNIGEKQVNVA